MCSGRNKKTGILATIGARLTLWGTLTTLSVCASVCVVLYLGLRFSLHSEVDAFLEGEVQEFCAILQEDRDEDLRALEEEVRLELGSRLRGDLTFRLLDAEGRLIVASDPDDRLPKPWLIPDSSRNKIEVPWFETVHLSGSGQSLRICSQWTRHSDGTLYIAQATYLLDRVAASLESFRNICIAAMLFAAVLSIVGGRLLARRSLHPVHQMTEAVKRISANRLSQRLTQSGSGDELDRLAGTLNDMLARIESQFLQMQQFTADAAHELRTPLTALRGNAEVALTNARDERSLRRVIEESIQQYDHLARIADNLLLLARLDAGEAILHRERLRLDKAIEDVVDLYAPYSSDRGIQLVIGQCAQVILNADKERVRQVLSNLIDNAIKYSTAPARIDVSLDQANGVARIAISDTGRGMSADDLPHVFDRFYRADRARPRSGFDRLRRRSGEQGVGLGLPICRSIVEAHGGDITIESRQGRGTTVLVSLPVDTKEPNES
ncbi:MAG: heavy metal sensor histidine kinase [Planctomycetes bacterium]|nr:heavy metal sensor histidine kinase [Planctomycetota bacterium]